MPHRSGPAELFSDINMERAAGARWSTVTRSFNAAASAPAMKKPAKAGFFMAGRPGQSRSKRDVVVHIIKAASGF